SPLGPGAFRRGQRFVEVGARRIGHARDRACSDRIDDIMAVAAFARLPGAVDEELQLGFISHGGSDRPALMHPQRPATRTVQRSSHGMTKSELVAKMAEKQAWVPGKRVKIDFGGSEGAG